MLAKIPQDIGELPGGGRFRRAPDGKLNGLIYEELALLRFFAVAPFAVRPELIATALAAYTKQAAAAGNTTLHEPGTIKPDWVGPLAKLSNTLDLRMSASLRRICRGQQGLHVAWSRREGKKDPRQPILALWHENLGGRLEPGRERRADKTLPAYD